MLMKSVKTLFYSVDNSKSDTNILIDVDNLFNKNETIYKNVFKILDSIEATPSKELMDKILSEI